MELLRPSSIEELDGGVLVHGGTEVVPLLREGLLDAEQLVDVRGVVPRGVQDGTIGAGTTLAELETEPAIPDALREACRLHGGDRCHARDGEHREHAIFENAFCASAHPSDVAAALVALGGRLRTNRRELAIEELYRLPDEGNRSTTTLEDGELLLEVELPPVETSAYLKAMDRKRWSFPQVGVAAARHADGSTRIALAGVAPIPWRIESIEELDTATPLPRTGWKVPLARALVRRALDALA